MRTCLIRNPPFQRDHHNELIDLNARTRTVTTNDSLTCGKLNSAKLSQLLGPDTGRGRCLGWHHRHPLWASMVLRWWYDAVVGKWKMLTQYWKLNSKHWSLNHSYDKHDPILAIVWLLNNHPLRTNRGCALLQSETFRERPATWTKGFDRNDKTYSSSGPSMLVP